jgi:3-oxoacyl-[acyl-carrier protein] reductase
MVDFSLSALGRVDILVNNAICSTDAIHSNSWENVEVALGGVWNCTQALLPSMIERASGSVVNISSAIVIAGLHGISEDCGSYSRS